MIAAARVSAAIDVLDKILGGAPVDTSLTNWGRANRYAGSADRAAVRDLVYHALRCKRSFAALGGTLSGGTVTGRNLMLGLVRASGQDVASIFTGVGHAPAAPTALDAEQEASPLQSLDCPDWLAPRLQTALGNDFVPVMAALQHRAPVFLRVNLGRTSRDEVQKMLAAIGIETDPHALAVTALQVLTPTRKLMTTQAYLTGLIDLQDAASQAVTALIPLADGQSVLDYCAGAGGKSLALAARAKIAVWAHDADLSRMRDLPARAARAGASVGVLADPRLQAPYSVVLADVPCSGSGSWRRDPVGKWALTEARLIALLALQAQILDQASALVAPQGIFAYATCSLLAEENQYQIAAFLSRHAGWAQLFSRHFTPLDGGDGFFVALLSRSEKL